MEIEANLQMILYLLISYKQDTFKKTLISKGNFSISKSVLY